jgi:FkbM family methyltransferase
MSFVSYAQNFEDAMLWRALRHVANGTYVDVGAQDPVVDSVSKAFYEHGWRGVHIEPVPFYADRLRRDRPDEIVLQAALGETVGTLALTVIPGTGLSTAVHEHAQRHHEAGFKVEETHVPMLTLTSALGMLAGRDVHWLKIDVEGFEESVLKGWDSTVLRPWIMVIEATIPSSSETEYAHWDPIVLAAGYRFVYFDGLNRFYVADEHAELAAAFATPPNVFDGIELSGQSSWGLYRRVAAQQQARLEQVEAEAKALAGELVMQGTALETSRASLAEREAELAQQGARLAECEAAIAERGALIAERDATLAEQARAAAQSAELVAQLGPLRRQHEDAERRIAAMHAEIHDWWSVADRLNHEVQALHASTSWRVTAPLRSTRDLAVRLPGLARRAPGWAGRRLRKAGRPLALWTVRTVLAHPSLRQPALRLLARHPGLKQYLRGFAGRTGLIALAAEPAMTPEAPVPGAAPASPAAGILVPTGLGKRAGRIYEQLKRQSS